MSGLPDIHLAHPRTVAEAVAARRQHPGSRFIAGGSDLIVNMRHGLSNPDLLIDLSVIDALADNPVIASDYQALAQAAEAVAGPGHRAMGTVGGNLCLDTRCIFYNQSEWWRRSNGYCLKRHGDVCHVAPQG